LQQVGHGLPDALGRWSPNSGAGGSIQRPPELKLPPDWKQRTRVFVTRAKKPRTGLAPLVSREVYDAERPPSHAGKAPPRPGHGDDRALRDLFALWRQ
jgi:hypothetical protein